MGSRMLGRDGQLEALRRLTRAALAGEPAAALVTGEAGIGKTRLVSELTHELGHRDVLVARGQCTAGSRDVPLGPVLDALRDLRRSLGPEAFADLADGRLPDVQRLLPELGPSGERGGPALGTAQVLGATSGLLRDVAAGRPTTLVLEDVHWSDESSRDVVDHLVRSMRGERLAVVVTVRTDDPAFDEVRGFLAELSGLPSVQRVELPRLGPDDVAAQVHDLSPGMVDAATLDRILELSGGVPLLVEELVAADDLDLGELAVRVLGHRVTRLSPTGQSVVRAAALAAVDVRPADLADVVDLPADEFDRGLAAATSGGVLVRRGPTVDFRHALLREAVIADVPLSEARRIHLGWARRLEPVTRTLPQAVAVAHHLTEAGRPGPAVRAWLRAADQADRISAYPEQARMLREAAEVWPAAPEAERPAGTDLADVLTRAAESALVGVARPQEVRELVQEALRALPGDADAARRAWLGVLWDRSRWHDDEHLTWEQAVATAGDIPASPPKRRILTCLWVAGACRRAARLDEAQRFAAEASHLAASSGDPELTVRADTVLAQVESALGHDEAAVSTGRRALRVAEQLGNLAVLADALMFLGIVLWNAGEDEESTALTERLVDVTGGDRPGPLPAAWGMSVANLAEGRLDQGRWDEADVLIRRVMDHRELSEYVFWAAERLQQHLAAWRGEPRLDLTDAPPVPRRNTIEDTDVDDLVAVGYTSADAASLRGHLALARAITTNVLADDRVAMIPGFLHRLLAVAARIEADAATGSDPDPETGQRIVDRVLHLLEIAPPRNVRDEASAATARAEIARRARTDAALMWEDVVSRWRQTVQPYPLGWALLRAGTAHAREGDHTAARRALAEALVIADRLGAVPLRDATLAAGRTARLRLAPTSASAAGLGLTDRELDVLRLVAAGASNGTIARELFISPKTVSVHVSHILAKLGVATRGEAAAAAYASGVLDGQPSA